MPSALETLMKILRLEREQGYNNTAVIGGLGAFAQNWQNDAHAQARRPEHHVLVDELVDLMREYDAIVELPARHERVKYMVGRITGRVASRDTTSEEGKASSTATPDRKESKQAEYPRETRGKEMRRRVSEKRKARGMPGGKQSSMPDQDHPSGKAISQPVEAGAEPPDEPPAPEDPAFLDTQVRPKPRRKPRSQPSHEEAVERLYGLSASVTVVERVGERLAEKLGRLGVHSVGDLLYHVPRRYDDYTRLVPISKAHPGETLTLIGTVRTSVVQKARTGKQYLHVTVDDGTGTLTVFFFGQPYLRNQLKRGVQVVISGRVDLYLGKTSMSNPEWELLEYDNLHTRAIVPVYPLTKGLTARTMRRILKTTVDYWSARLPDYVPESVLDRAELVELGWALQQVHFPENWDYLDYARERLAFDELFLLQLAMLARRRAWQQVPGVPQAVEDRALSAMIDRLPFELTGAQRRAVEEIRTDMARATSMNRLLQGDVGSGKTAVAALAMAITVMNGGQVALMAPTSILAEQHFRAITQMLAVLMPEHEIAVRLLTGATSASEREQTLWLLGEGSISVVVGTHALIQPDVNFDNLTLIIIDEQHRFGVSQRGQLRSKGTSPHLLVMTATPIPRTLALTVHADLDLTVIDEMPPGRTPVETHLLPELERERAYTFITKQVQEGRQAFVVYPLVEAESPEEETQAAVDEYDRLARDVFPSARVGLLHGRMRPEEKDEVMTRFKAGEFDVLVSTSVVEVGIDIPNASVILIEGANRFGLAQLHQFRGRVGRGQHKSYCLMIGDISTDDARKRLEAMQQTADGFELAEIDYNLRGAGELLGTRQSGIGARLRFGGDLQPPLVALAQREARTLYEEDPDLSLPEHSLLAERVRMWQAVETDIS
jgi:ATP-dependent DNA helicase RecG